MFPGSKCCSNKSTYLFECCSLKFHFSAFLPLDFQVDDHLLAAVERGDIAHRRSCTLKFGVNFVVGVRIQAAEAIIPFAVGKLLRTALVRGFRRPRCLEVDYLIYRRDREP